MAITNGIYTSIRITAIRAPDEGWCPAPGRVLEMPKEVVPCGIRGVGINPARLGVFQKCCPREVLDRTEKR